MSDDLLRLMRELTGMAAVAIFMISSAAMVLGVLSVLIRQGNSYSWPLVILGAPAAGASWQILRGLL